jgi:hypothetical protein
VKAPATRAWALLLALSLGSTLLAAFAAGGPGGAGPVAGAAMLILAWAKARTILTHYLGLSRAPLWRRGFALVLGLYMALLLGLALAA